MGLQTLQLLVNLSIQITKRLMGNRRERQTEMEVWMFIPQDFKNRSVHVENVTLVPKHNLKYLFFQRA